MNAVQLWRKRLLPRRLPPRRAKRMLPPMKIMYAAEVCALSMYASKIRMSMPQNAADTAASRCAHQTSACSPPTSSRQMIKPAPMFASASPPPHADAVLRRAAPPRRSAHAAAASSSADKRAAPRRQLIKRRAVCARQIPSRAAAAADVVKETQAGYVRLW
jgi:hypothetical protein